MTDRKHKITQELVNTTCSTINKANENVTVSAVIKQIGGSFSTVGTMVKQWKQERKEEERLDVIEMPEIVNKAMKKATAEIWQAVSALASEEVQQARKKAETITTEAKAELLESLNEISRLESEVEKSDSDKKEAEKQSESLQTVISKMQSQNIILETRLKDRKEELKQLHNNYSKLQDKLFELAKKNSQ